MWKLILAIVLAVLVVGVLILWLMALRCRRNHPAWGVLGRYRYAHRGLHDKAHGVPENSMAAFRRAAVRGFGAELDVHLTRDGRLAVIHDRSLLRTAGVDVDVTSLTARELATYHLEGTQEGIPMLEDVLALFEGRGPLIVELKVDDNAAALAQAACRVMDRYQVNYCMESFHPSALMWLKKHRPDICRGQLSENFLRNRNGLPWLAAFVMTNLFTNLVAAPDFVAYRFQHRRRLSLWLIRHLWRGQEVSWTLRTPQEMAECEETGSLSIFENFVPKNAVIACK